MQIEVTLTPEQQEAMQMLADGLYNGNLDLYRVRIITDAAEGQLAINRLMADKQRQIDLVHLA